MSSQN
ncbi:hypothetical protein EE612_046877 [Oryza sativa]